MGIYPAKNKVIPPVFADRMRVFILGSIAGLALRALAFSWRWRTISGLEHVTAAAKDGPIICTFWHCQQLVMPEVLRLMRRRCRFKDKMHALHSHHADGRISNRAISFSGIHGIAGSSTRGGDRALRALVKTMADGNSVAMTPDGPKGPPRRSKMGVVKLAQLSGRPILPMACVATSFWSFKSWDRLFIPKFFSPLSAIFSKPLYIPRDADAEETNRLLVELDQELERLTKALEIGRNEMETKKH